MSVNGVQLHQYVAVSCDTGEFKCFVVRSLCRFVGPKKIPTCWSQFLPWRLKVYVCLKVFEKERKV